MPETVTDRSLEMGCYDRSFRCTLAARMPGTSAHLESGNRRLLRDLAALERLTSGEGGEAYRRLEANLGPERARFLVHALTRGNGGRGESLRPAASA
jgi:hypothetical protein